MEKHSTDEYPEELKALCVAAFRLASFPYHIMGKRKAAQLRQLKECFAQEQRTNQCRPEIQQGYQESLEKIAAEVELDQLSGLMTSCSIPFEKKLTTTDLKDDQGRLNICGQYVENAIQPLLKPWEDLRKGVPVTIYVPNVDREYPMVLKTWVVKTHVLTSGWKQLYHEHKLVVDDYITLWMFRHARTGNVCFAIVFGRLPIQPHQKCKTNRKNGAKKMKRLDFE